LKSEKLKTLKQLSTDILDIISTASIDINSDLDSKLEKLEKLKSTSLDQICQTPTSVAVDSFAGGNLLKKMPSGDYMSHRSL
jgi:tRNA uridine 5-carbamoylmethylation protein Kti12